MARNGPARPAFAAIGSVIVNMQVSDYCRVLPFGPISKLEVHHACMMYSFFSFFSSLPCALLPFFFLFLPSPSFPLPVGRWHMVSCTATLPPPIRRVRWISHHLDATTLLSSSILNNCLPTYLSSLATCYTQYLLDMCIAQPVIVRKRTIYAWCVWVVFV